MQVTECIRAIVDQQWVSENDLTALAREILAEVPKERAQQVGRVVDVIVAESRNHLMRQPNPAIRRLDLVREALYTPPKLPRAIREVVASFISNTERASVFYGTQRIHLIARRLFHDSVTTNRLIEEWRAEEMIGRYQSLDPTGLWKRLPIASLHVTQSAWEVFAHVGIQPQKLWLGVPAVETLGDFDCPTGVNCLSFRNTPIHFLPSLPQDLKRLDIAGTKMSLDEAKCASMPPKLQSLTISLKMIEICPHALLKLPDTLTSLSVRGKRPLNKLLERSIHIQPKKLRKEIVTHSINVAKLIETNQLSLKIILELPEMIREIVIHQAAPIAQLLRGKKITWKEINTLCTFFKLEVLANPMALVHLFRHITFARFRSFPPPLRTDMILDYSALNAFQRRIDVEGISSLWSKKTPKIHWIVRHTGEISMLLDNDFSWKKILKMSLEELERNIQRLE